MSRFASLDKRNPTAPKTGAAVVAEAQTAPIAESADDQPKRSPTGRAKAREGKKPIIGYFSEELSRELRTLAVKENTTMQALMGEAFDLLMTARGINRFNER